MQHHRVRSQLRRLALACAGHAPADVCVRDGAWQGAHAVFVVLLHGLTESAPGINFWGGAALQAAADTRYPGSAGLWLPSARLLHGFRVTR